MPEEFRLNEKGEVIMTEAKKKYGLYLFSTNIGEENLKEAMSYRFNRINQRYVLVYTDELSGMLQECHYHIIDEKETDHLSDSEKVWLLDANIKIIAEETAKRQDELLTRFNERLSQLEEELEKESGKISNGNQDDNG